MSSSKCMTNKELCLACSVLFKIVKDSINNCSYNLVLEGACECYRNLIWMKEAFSLVKIVSDA